VRAMASDALGDLLIVLFAFWILAAVLCGIYIVLGGAGSPELFALVYISLIVGYAAGVAGGRRRVSPRGHA